MSKETALKRLRESQMAGQRIEVTSIHNLFRWTNCCGPNGGRSRLPAVSSRNGRSLSASVRVEASIDVQNPVQHDLICGDAAHYERRRAIFVVVQVPAAFQNVQPIVRRHLDR